MTDRPTDNDKKSDSSACSRLHSTAIDADESHSVAVVRTVAAVTNTPPLGLNPLHDVIDTESLDRLFERPEDTGTAGKSITFEFEGCEITVTQDTVGVQKIDDE